MTIYLRIMGHHHFCLCLTSSFIFFSATNRLFHNAEQSWQLAAEHNINLFQYNTRNSTVYRSLLWSALTLFVLHSSYEFVIKPDGYLQTSQMGFSPLWLFLSGIFIHQMFVSVKNCPTKFQSFYGRSGEE